MATTTNAAKAEIEDLTGGVIPTPQDVANWNAKNLAERSVGSWNPVTNTPALNTILLAVGDYAEIEVEGKSSIPTGVQEDYSFSDIVIKTQTGYAHRRKASAVGKKAVAPENTTFVGTDKQLFNKQDPTNAPGKYVLYTTGKLGSNATYTASHFMPVGPGVNIAVPAITQTAFYSAPNEDAYISGINSGGSSKTFVTPPGTAYMRMSILTSQVDSWMITVGTVLPEQYQGFYVLKGIDFSDLFIIARMIAEKAVGTSKLADFAVIAEKLGIASVVSEKIAKNAVLPELTSFLRTGKNKFNINHPDNKIGYFVGPDSRGELRANATYNTTHFIPVSAAVDHFPSFKHQLAYYDLNRKFISGEMNTRADQYFTPPAGTEWVRLSVSAASWANFQLEEGRTGTANEAFFYQFNGVKVSVSDAAILSSMLAEMAVTTTKIALKAITTERIADKAVTPLQTNFILESVGKQKFNKDQVEIGMYQNETGFRGGNAGYVLSGFTRVEVGKTYTGKGASGNGYRFVTYFNEAQQWVGGVKDAGQQFTVPTGVAFAKITIFAGDLDSFMLVLGTTAANTWEAYQTVFDLTIAGKVLRATALSDTLYADIARYIKENQSSEAPVPGPEFSIAPKYYWPLGKEFNLYTENTLLNHDTWKGHIDLAVSGGIQTGRSLKVKPTTASTLNITGSFLDAKFDVAFPIASQLRVVPLTNTNPTVIQIFGDSYTRRATFIEPLMATVPQGISFVGIKDSANSTPSVKSEGRGGWTLVQYITLSKVWYSPFVHPLEGSYLYMGNTEFWQKANQGLPDSVGQGYDYNWFNVKDQFNPATGYPLAPRANDVIYDNTQSKFFFWSGSAWTEIAEATLRFGISYSKYRQAWGIAPAQIIHPLLGTNDFAGATVSTFPGLYAAFKARYDSLIASIKADLPNVKIVIGIPVSSGRQGADGVGTSERRKRVFKLLHSAMIADYANREGENLYIADYHSTVDRVYGYGRTYNKPFEEYTGTETLTLSAQQTEAYTSDTVHLNKDGFTQMGLQFMALIQALRPI